MTKILPLDVVIRLTLCKLYELTTLKGFFKVDADTIAKEIGHGVLSGFVTLALNNLAEQAFVSTFGDGKDGLMAHLTPKGAREAELDLRNPDSLMNKFQRFGDQAIRDQIVEAGGVPASDRIVALDHNSAEYQSVKAGIERLEQQVRANNQVGNSAEERDQILKSLASARELWSAAQLSVMQIKVGVLLAVESAINALIKVGQSVGKSIIVDGIKAYVKSKTGIEF